MAQPDVGGEVRALHAARTVTLKARVIGGDRPAPQAEQGLDEEQQLFGLEGTVDPPYDPNTLAILLEHSNSLRQNLDAYVVNIHGHGHHFEAIIDLASDDANTQIANLLFEARQREQRKPDPAIADPNEQAELPTAEEVEEAKKELEEQMRTEKMRLKRFFDNASLDMSFEQLRMITCLDKELIGNGYWEVLRDATGDIAQFNYVPGFTVRLMPLDPCATAVEEKVRVDDVTWGEIQRFKRFRVYVQILQYGFGRGNTGGEAVFFKELGDPRLISAMTGREFASVDEMRSHNEHDRPATEILPFKVHSPRSAYGVPRWIGQLLSVLGSRQVDEINFEYFNNKSVPPLAFLVSGGRVTEETVNRLEDHIQAKIQGKHNFHKVLIFEAEGTQSPMGEHSGRARIEMKDLRGSTNQDALFQKYDERNIDKVGMAFRLARLLRGDIRDFNRATADAALDFTEKQVFAPLRREFDFVMNRKVLPLLGIRFWKFVSNAPELTDATELGKLIALLTEEGVLTPFEARQLSEKVFNRELRNIDAPWTRQPIELTVAGIAPPAIPVVGEDGQPTEPEEEAAATADAPPDIELTGTDLASIVTVNEVREQRGLKNLKKPGTEEDDPDGFLTVAEFKAKRTTAGEVEGEQEAEAKRASKLTTGDLGEGGLLLPAQGDRKRPKIPSIEMAGKMQRRALLNDARYLVAMRAALAEAEYEEAERAFDQQKAYEDGDDAAHTTE